MDLLNRLLRKTRPASLTMFLKAVFGVKRQVVTTHGGQQFFVDPVSHFGGEVIDTGTYEPALTQLCTTLLRPSDTFVDVGANEGYFSVVSGSRVGPNGAIFAFEPQSRLQPILVKNFALNQTAKATICNEALSDSDGEAVLHLTANTNSGGSSLHARGKHGTGHETVKTTTLDVFFRKHSIGRVRLMKVDCEGAELLVVHGAAEILKQKKIDFISIDFHPGLVGREVPVQIDRELRGYGYCLSAVGSGLWVYHLPTLRDELLALGVPKEIPSLSL